MMDLGKSYDPAAVEHGLHTWWEEQGLNRASPGADGPACCMAVPPPSASAVLHLGHALNFTVQDLLARWQRMQGYNILWPAGAGLGGIASEHAVEVRLRAEGIDPRTMEREAFLARVREWEAECATTVGRQLRALGVSFDAEHSRAACDAAFHHAVNEAFVRLFEKGLIYRAEAVVNWCPRCGAALSDEECEPRESEGVLYSIRFPVKGGRKKDALVAVTTRPETLPATVALAVNPRDERYRHVVGKTILLPLFGRALPVIEDDSIDPRLGTGVVPVRPAHDANDFEMARRHELPAVHAIDREGLMREASGPYAGQDAAACRKNLLEDLRHGGLLEEDQPFMHTVGHCRYCREPLLKRLTSQWFVKMKPLARPAIDAVKQANVRVVPERWSKVLLERLENIRDWCISRQTRSGFRLPVYTCAACGHERAATTAPGKCAVCGSDDLQQIDDVLDAGFALWLWPFALLGWPEQTPELERYYPALLLPTASESLFARAGRTLMAGLEFMGAAPYAQVVVHGTLRDETGRKIGPRQGNATDPLDAVNRHGADALRFGLISSLAGGQDAQLTDEVMEQGRAFAASLWGVARFMQAHGAVAREPSDVPDFDKELLTPDDKHLLAKLHETLALCEESLLRFRFHEYARNAHDFLRRRFADWYVGYCREIFQGDNGARQEQVRLVLQYVFSHGLRLLHPMMPFITESLWRALGYSDSCCSIMRAPWPKAIEEEQLAADWGVTSAMVHYVDARQDLISVGRALRDDYDIKASQPVSFIIRPARERDENRLRADGDAIARLLKAGSVTVDADFSPPRTIPSALCQLGAIYMPLEGLIDREAEAARLREQAEKVSGQLKLINRKMENMDFLSKAPAQVVEQERARKKELLDKHEKLRKMLETLAGGDAT